MKTCGKCKQAKPTVEFSKNSTKPDGLQGQCKECKRKTDAAGYKKNKIWYDERNRKVKIVNKEFVRSAKDVPCADCGLKYPPYVMDFDHLNSAIKVNNISAMAGQGWSLKRIKEEIDKCEVVCSNCHRIRTWNRAQHSGVGELVDPPVSETGVL